MRAPKAIEASMIAVCGVNCAYCQAHLKKKKPCGGCRAPDDEKRTSCVNCAKKRCADEKGLALCAECADFPCPRMKQLAKAYRRYGIDLLQNGRDMLRDPGGFLARERDRYTCPACGGAVCEHDGICSECGERPGR